jgi:hypothetical protein
MHEDPEGGLEGHVPYDIGKAAAMCTRAAGQGNLTAQCNLGDMFLEGIGVRKDPKQAADWYSTSTPCTVYPDTIHHALLHRTLYTIHSAPYTVHYITTHHTTDMIHCSPPCTHLHYTLTPHPPSTRYLKAADQESIDAQAHLGELYERGLGVDYNLERALEWLNKAAGMNSQEAQVESINSAVY